MTGGHQLGQDVFRSVLPEEIDWRAFPAFPPSVRLAVVVGDPARSGPYVIRVKVPAGVRLMPHRHPEDRIYTVMSGVFYVGLGDRFDGEAVRAYPPGSVIVLPGDTYHFHWAKSGEYVTQVTAIGPLGLEYKEVNDDPRHTAREADGRAALDRHWAASNEGNEEADGEIYCDDVELEYPQSGEIFHGRRNVLESRAQNPAKRRFEVQRTLGSGDLWIIEYVIFYDGRPVPTVSIMEFLDGKVAREIQYFADPFEAPPWRAKWRDEAASGHVEAVTRKTERSIDR